MKKFLRFLTFRFLEDPQSIKNRETISKKRTKMIFTILFVFFFMWIILFNIGQMTILGRVRGENLTEIANQKYTVDRIIEPKRGKIFDRNGNVLADNIESYKLVAVVSEKASEGLEEGKEIHVKDINKTAEVLANYIKLSKEQIVKILDNSKAYQVEFGSFGKDISVDIKRKIEAENLPGIKFESTTKRYYPNGSMLGNFLGFAQSSNEAENILEGQLGVEKVFDNYLKGKIGRVVYARDAWGKVVSNVPTTEEASVDGADVYLTIDKNIQSYVDNSLKEIQEKYDPELAFAVVVNAKTAEILGIGQSPAFNPNTKENLEYAWTNAIFNTAIEPGSTMKTFALAASIEDGIFSPNKFYQSGAYRIDDAVIYDWNRTGWGTITYRHGFQESSNTLMLTMLEELGSERLKLAYDKFGFGKATNSLYDNESSGQLTFSNKVSAATSIFGQGSTVTPIQMLQAETAIINDGNMLKPYFLQKIYDKNTNTNVNEGSTEVVGNPISKETAEKVREELYGVINGNFANGGKKYAIDGYSVSGKTGTAEVVNPENGMYYQNKYKVLHSFLGYAPSDNPEVIVYTAIKLPRKNLAENFATSTSELLKPIMSNTLDYLSVKKEAGEDDNKIFTLSDYKNLDVNLAINSLSNHTKEIYVIGSGETVLSQFPSANNQMNSSDKVFLLTDTSTIKLPNFKGWSKSDLETYAVLSGLKFSISGSGYVSEQSIGYGKIVSPETEIRIKLS